MGTLLRKSSRWTTDMLEGLRQETDPLADEAIQILLDGDQSLYSINRLFDQLVTNDDLIPSEFPKELKTYFETSQQLPAWFDKKMIFKAQEVYANYGPQVNMILMCKSLPTCYACMKGAQVLHMTGRMSEHGGNLNKFSRRIMETAQFILNTMEPGSFGPDGRAIRSMQKVRLIHASIRYYLKGNWDAELYDQPINQEDMLGTMLSMSYQIADGLETLDIDLSEEEKKAFAHYGKILGYMIGIKEEYLPETYSEDIECTAAILDHQAAPSEAGTELTQACVKFMEDIIPGKVFDDVPEMYMHFFIGDELADLLKLKKTNDFFQFLLEKQTRFFNNMEEHFSDKFIVFKKVTEKINMLLLDGMINYFNQDKSVHFYIPPSLTRNWKRKDVWKRSWASKLSLFERRLAIEKKDSTIVNKLS